MPYFGEQHLPYAILAISVLVIFVVLPGVLLLLYPLQCFQKFLNLFPVRWYVLYTFMDSILGCYKDGTQPGTRDCRWFASVFFFARVSYIVVGFLTLNIMFYPIISALLIILVISLIHNSTFQGWNKPLLWSQCCIHPSSISVLYMLIWTKMCFSLDLLL